MSSLQCRCRPVSAWGEPGGLSSCHVCLLSLYNLLPSVFFIHQMARPYVDKPIIVYGFMILRCAQDSCRCGGDREIDPLEPAAQEPPGQQGQHHGDAAGGEMLRPQAAGLRHGVKVMVLEPEVVGLGPGSRP